MSKYQNRTDEEKQAERERYWRGRQRKLELVAKFGKKHTPHTILRAFQRGLLK